jgi:N-acetylglucosaminyldiphosphoundecaprenol N-acetyl-beta-D-mannosaminyltransferase
MRPTNSQIALLGIRVDDVSLDEAVSIIDSMIDSGVCHQVATANVDFLSKAVNDQELREILNGCELVLPDGMPLVWASRLMGASLKERVTGADLFPRLLELSARKKRRIFLLGATEERSLCTLERIRREYPEAEICGRLAPPMAPLDLMANDEMLKAIEDARPDILMVAFGNPKQEKWLAMHRHRLNVPVCIGVGASVDFFSGQQSRAPLWMQRSGMEWMYRLFSEPRRLGPRYLDNALFLLRYLSLQLFITSVQPSKSSATKISMTRLGQVLIVRIAGDFTGPAVSELRKGIESELASGCSLIVDLSASRAIRPDAAGFLVGFTREMMVRDAQVWLVGVQRGVRNVLRSTFPAGHNFRIAATVQDAMRALQLGGDDFGLRPPATYTTPSTTWSTFSLFAQSGFVGADRRSVPRGVRTFEHSVPGRAEQREAAAVE